MSGWPVDVQNDPEKQSEYVANYLIHEGVELDANNIVNNPGKRSVANDDAQQFLG